MAVIGSIYSKASFTNLDDFETNGGFTVSSGKIITPADSSKYIRLPTVTALDKYKASIRFRWLSASGSDTGLSIGLVSINTAVAWSFIVNGVLRTGDSNLGKVYISTTANAGNSYGTSAVARSINDVFQLSIEYNSGVITATFTNETQSQSSVYTFSNTFTYGSPFVNTNSAKVTIQASSTSYEVLSIDYSSNIQSQQPLAVGDSITEGAYAGSAANRWATLLGYQISGGSGDTSTQVLQRATEIINTIRPTGVWLMIGTNDAFQGVPLETSKSNIRTFVTLLEAAGIPVIKMCPPPENDADTLPIAEWLTQEYPGTCIVATYYGMVDGSGNLLTMYDSTDGIHLNAAGNGYIHGQVLDFAPTYNLTAETPGVVVATKSADFVSLGFTTVNISIVYLVGNPTKSWKPGRTINGITGFESNKGYYIVPKTSRDLSANLVPSAAQSL